MDNKLRILVTGGAGFIGTHLINDLMNDGFEVWGIDSFNNHYDPQLKHERVKFFRNPVSEVDMKDLDKLDEAFAAFRPEIVIHLGARANVRDSFGHERLYHQDNVDATQNLIDVCKMYDVSRVIYASTSSVYGGTPVPKGGWVEPEVTGHQLNAYAYTKYVNECQFKVSGLNNTGLRFFTVYGPWGRPDMALFQFTQNIIAGKPVVAFNHGDMKRDFTYIGDIIAGIKQVLFAEIPSNEIFNIGRGKQVDLMHFISCIGKELGREPKIEYAPKHPADTKETWSNTNKLADLGYRPRVNIEQGVEAFVGWYKNYYMVN